MSAHSSRPGARTAPLALLAGALAAFSAGAAAQAVPGPAFDVPFVPTPPQVVERMLQMVDVRPGDFVIDLGSGDGRIAIAAARKGARALGVDIDPRRVREAQENARNAGVEDRVTFRRENLFDTGIGEATVVTMYLLPDVNMRLRPRLLDELKPGTRVVSHAFDLVDWKADRHAMVGYREVFMWIVPAKVAGRWRVTRGEESFTLTLTQKFQHFSGSADAGGDAVEVKEGRLEGADIRFTLGNGSRFHGFVNGERIESVPQSPDNTAGGWHATRLP
jgi:SAM-dependent methyltransferase